MIKHLSGLALVFLALSCTEASSPPPENTAATCADNADNDLDGDTDCDDKDCSPFPNCNVVLPEICDNGIDDNNNNDIDCIDVQCANDPICGFEACANGVDDDGDSLVDCADADCVNDSACTVQGDCAGLPGEIVEVISAGDILEDTTVGVSLTTGTNTGIVQKCGLGVGGGKELVYQFTPAASGTLDLTLTSDTDQGIYVRSSCGDPSSEIACADEFISLDETISVAVTGGAPLFIFVDAFDVGTEGLFILTTALQ